MTVKLSYAINCSSKFRDSVIALAQRRGINVGDLARSILLAIPAAIINPIPDPGEPSPEDRETIILKSGRNAGKPWSRKPRLQVRLPSGYHVGIIRKALGLALAIDKGETVVTIEDGEKLALQDSLKRKKEENLRLHSIVKALAFAPLPNGVKSRGDALHVLGFPYNAYPNHIDIKARYRMLASIHHPDSGFGDHRRMSQLNEAMNCLQRAKGQRN